MADRGPLYCCSGMPELNDPKAARIAMLERELWKARVAVRQVVKTIPQDVSAPLALRDLVAGAREMERLAGQVASFASLLLSEQG